MRYLLFAFLSALLFAACSVGDKEITTFILVRHAEKADDGTDDPPLTLQGEARAKRLANLFEDASLNALYSTHYKRTRLTAEPLSATKNLEVQTYEAFKPEAIAEMLERHRGGVVFVTGHSNNIPWTANLLLGNNAFADYDESQYSIILVVSVVEIGNGSVLRLVY